MKLPRDLSGEQLAHALARLGYQVTRQTGAHLRLTTADPSEHHITIPNRDPLRVGTLAAILSSSFALLRSVVSIPDLATAAPEKGRYAR
jgi:predicted RNA binding protein YcfA (HicA-like mRNA interferase family)